MACPNFCSQNTVQLLKFSGWCTRTKHRSNTQKFPEIKSTETILDYGPFPFMLSGLLEIESVHCPRSAIWLSDILCNNRRWYSMNHAPAYNIIPPVYCRWYHAGKVHSHKSSTSWQSSTSSSNTAFPWLLWWPPGWIEENILRIAN